jgi:hypothetical protein
MSKKHKRLKDLDLDKVVIREMKFGELVIILARFHIMLESMDDVSEGLGEGYSEFIEQEHFRRDLYKNYPTK